MKILILGGDGMLGHQLLLSLQNKYDVHVTLRQEKHAYQAFPMFHAKNSYFGIDVLRENDVARVMQDLKPAILINAIGLVKQRSIACEALPNLEVNALLPHRLAMLCEKYKTRFLHVSTDCVFSGRKGGYTEQDISDAEDYYGRSKYLGEVHYPHCLTVRTSFIGLELSRKTSLLEWFLAQTGEIKGFCRAIYSGITTQEMGNVVDMLLTRQPDLSGVWHVASEPISKYDLLMQLKNLLQRDDIIIKPDNDFICDRSLSGSAFEQKTGYRIPSWDAMLKQLAEQIQQREADQVRLACSA